MIGTDSNHCRIVAESLAGRREVDEQTFDALAALGQKLERLRQLDGIFSRVEFSPDVEKLLGLRTTIAVG
jgi:hypothetical protein